MFGVVIENPEVEGPAGLTKPAKAMVVKLDVKANEADEAIKMVFKELNIPAVRGQRIFAFRQDVSTTTERRQQMILCDP